MNRASGSRFLWSAAAVAFAVGLLLSVQSFRAMGRASARFKQKLVDIGRLRDVDAQVQASEAACRMFDALPSKRPEALADALRAALPGVEVTEAPEARRDAVPGWSVRRKELAISDAPLDALMKFLDACETNRPPWHLVKYALRASSQPGRAQVVLVMEAADASRCAEGRSRVRGQGRCRSNDCKTSATRGRGDAHRDGGGVPDRAHEETSGTAEAADGARGLRTAVGVLQEEPVADRPVR